MKNTVNVAILGFGVVGGGVAELIAKNSALLKKRLGGDICVKRVLDLRTFPDSPFASIVTPSFDDIVNDKEISVVAECMGGSHPAYEFSKACLESGKSVVTSNKEVVANYGPELLRIARENNVRYIFEAAVGGGIPCLRPFEVSLAVNNITEVNGILNGTTNYILTEMTENGSEFSEVLAEAQRLGYAEKDPTDDVEAIDASRKIVILCALAYGLMPKASDVCCKGITKITPDILSAAAELGCKIKLVAHASKRGEKLFLKVEPAFVTKECLLGSVDGVFNAVAVTSEALDDVMFCGKGAGRYPTASAVLADVFEAALRPTEQPDVHVMEYNSLPVASISEFDGRWVAVFEGDDEETFAKRFPEASIKHIPTLGFVLVITDVMNRGEFEALVSEQESDGNKCHGVFELK